MGKRIALVWIGVSLAVMACESSDGESNTQEADLLISGPGPNGEGSDGELLSGGETGGSEAIGEGTAPDVESVEAAGGPLVECTPYQEGETPVFGRVYEDAAPFGLSVHGFEPGDEDFGVIDWPVTLFPSGQQTVTCEDGRFAFTNVESGQHVVVVESPGEGCTTRNCPIRFPAALAEGEIQITTFGDSVPKVGSNLLFPARLQEMLNPLAEVTSRNVAVPGSRSVNWLPGTFNFNQELVPELANTDVLIASLGGNDVMAYASEVMSGGGGIAEALDGGVNEKLLEIMSNVLTIFEAAREINPEMDLVYCLYPNYANSAQWKEFLEVFPGVTTIVAGLIVDALEQVLEEMPMEPGMIVVDMYGAFGDEDLTGFLYDQLHFNDAGHQIYAEEIFRALGGVTVPESGEAFSIEFGFDLL